MLLSALISSQGHRGPSKADPRPAVQELASTRHGARYEWEFSLKTDLGSVLKIFILCIEVKEVGSVNNKIICHSIYPNPIHNFCEVHDKIFVMELFGSLEELKD